MERVAQTLLCCVRITIAQVFRDGAGEQPRLLRHIGNGTAYILLRQLPDILPV